MASGRLHLRLVAAASILFGGGSLLLFGLFLLRLPHPGLDLGLGARAALGWDALLCGVFFLQHSAMIRRSFRDRALRRVPEAAYPALYSVASGLALAALVLAWQPSGVALFELRGLGRWLVHAAFAAAVLAAAWAALSLRGFDVFGLRPLRGREGRPPVLSVRGPYRHVRHPLYALTLVVIWACPVLSADRLLFDVLFTGWIVAGARLEERDLVAAFGDAYRDYQRRVPMLVPRPFRRAPSSSGG